MKNNRYFFLITLLLLLTTAVFAQQRAAWPEGSRLTKPGTRWWWMGSAVDETNLRWNLQQYAKTGIGTVEITPIYGVEGNAMNEKSYLSQQWMQMLGVCQSEGELQGIDIDMNGGTGWPYGGPWVPLSEAAGKLEYDTEVITGDGTAKPTLRLTTSSTKSLNCVMAYPQQGTEGVPTDITATVAGTTVGWTVPEGTWRILAIYDSHTLQAVKRAAPGGEGYVVDHYDSTAVANYLAHIDQRFEQTGVHFPHTVFNDSYEVYGADWTPKMFAEFEKYRGYSLKDNMERLLGFVKDEGNQVLFDYRQTLSDMLLNNFTRQWTAWAHRHGATTRNQAHGSPGNLLDFYAAVDIPEIEGFGISDFKIRGLRTDEGFTSPNLSDLATLKYASSAAHVTGKPLTSSETFTWLSEHFRTSLSQMKPDMDLMFLAGVNHIFFHGTTYSPRDADWPGWKFYASIDMSPTNSLWRDAPAMMAYADRCQRFLQMGEPDNDLLVYAPFQYAMHQNTDANAARLQLFDINTLSQKIPSMVNAVQNIVSAGLDCDFASDSQLLATTVADGMLKTEGGTCYKALLVPVSENMPQSVAQHLEALQSQGATVIFGSSVQSLQPLAASAEPLRTELNLRCLRRKNASGHHYFVSNLSDKDLSGYAALNVPHASVALFNPMTGVICRGHEHEGKLWVSLKSGQSIIIQTYDGEVAVDDDDAQSGAAATPFADESAAPLVEGDGLKISTPWTLSFTEDTYPAMGDTVFRLEKAQTWESLGSDCAEAMGTGIYETTFTLTASQLAMGNGGWLLRLGDVRECARVYINNVYAGCAWSAPFDLLVGGKLREGTNKLRLEVTNLPANRIRQMDIRGDKWRIFKDVNILDIAGGKTSQANIRYNDWSLVPSGLNSDVLLVPLRLAESELQARLVGMMLPIVKPVGNATGDNDDGETPYYPVYLLSTPDGHALVNIEVLTAAGEPFAGYVVGNDDNNNPLLQIVEPSDSRVIVRATDSEGHTLETYLAADGGYQRTLVADFTTETAPLCGWTKMPSDALINGFSATGPLPWYRSTDRGTSLSTLFSGLTFSCERAAYYFFYPGYGMIGNYDFSIETPAQPRDLCVVSYMQGSGDDVYTASDSLLMFVSCADDADAISVEMRSKQSMAIYRTLAVYRPQALPDGMADAKAVLRRSEDRWYTLQGQAVERPRHGLYIHNGKKTLVK